MQTPIDAPAPQTRQIAAADTDPAICLATEVTARPAETGVLSKAVRELRAQFEAIRDGNEPDLSAIHAQELTGLGYAELRRASAFEISGEERRSLQRAQLILPGLEARNRNLKAELGESNRELSGFFSSIGLLLRGERAVTIRLRNHTQVELAELTPVLNETREAKRVILFRQQELDRERGRFGFIGELGVRLTAAGEKLYARLSEHEQSCGDAPIERFLRADAGVSRLIGNRIARARRIYEHPTLAAWSDRDRDSIAFNLSFHPGTEGEAIARHSAVVDALRERSPSWASNSALITQLCCKPGSADALAADFGCVAAAIFARSPEEKGNVLAAAALTSAAPSRLPAEERYREREILSELLSESPFGAQQRQWTRRYIASQLVPLEGTAKERIRAFETVRTALVGAGFENSSPVSIAAVALLGVSSPADLLAERAFQRFTAIAQAGEIPDHALYLPSIKLGMLPGSEAAHLRTLSMIRSALGESGLSGGREDSAERSVAIFRAVLRDAHQEVLGGVGAAAAEAKLALALLIERLSDADRMTPAELLGIVHAGDLSEKSPPAAWPRQPIAYSSQNSASRLSYSGSGFQMPTAQMPTYLGAAIGSISAR